MQADTWATARPTNTDPIRHRRSLEDGYNGKVGRSRPAATCGAPVAIKVADGWDPTLPRTCKRCATIGATRG